MGKDQELIEAARNGDFPVVEKILNSKAKKGAFSSLRRGPGANAQDANGFSALHHAAVNRHKAIVELLLSHEASTNIVDLRGSSPLHLAAWSGNEEIVKLLLTKGPSSGSGPNVNLMNKSSETALHMAAQFGHTEVVRLLLHHGADSVITNERHETALDLAAQYGRLETVQLLLKSHPELIACYASTTSTTNSSRQVIFPHSPLHLASRNGHRAVVEVLVKAKFAVNARTGQGTALHEAALCGKVDVVKTLLDAGIDVCVADSQRRTAVDRLSEVGLKTPVAKEIAELIRNALKKKSIQQGQSNSPLCSPHETGGVSGNATTPSNNNKDGNHKQPQQQQLHQDNQNLSSSASSSCYSGGGGTLRQYSSSPNHSPPPGNFARGKTRRSLDVSVGKGPDFERPAAFSCSSTSAPPKKPPRRNLSASPTHPGLPDLWGDPHPSHPPDLMTMGRNKSMDEAVYGERWRKSLTAYDTNTNTSQSTESIDNVSSPVERESANSNINPNPPRVSNGYSNNSSKSKSDLDSQYVSVAHIKLRDANKEDLAATQDEEANTTKDENYANSNYNNNKINHYAVVKHQKHVPIEAVSRDRQKDKDRYDERKYDNLLPRGPKPAIAPKPTVPPKPKNVKNINSSSSTSSSKGHQDQGKYNNNNRSKGGRAEGRSGSSILSPVDVDKEWENITLFMDSFNDGENGDIKLPNVYCLSPIGKWLASMKMTEYEQLLVSSGFDDLGFLGGDILDETSLLEIGMLNAQHRKIVAGNASKVEVKWPRSRTDLPASIDEWLKELHLTQYIATFRKNLYTDPARIPNLCNDELVTLLEIEPLGHRRRILLAAGRFPNCRQQFSRITPTQGRKLENGGSGSGGSDSDFDNEDGSLPLRDPNHLVSGVSSALKTAWRHSPDTLIEGSVAYKATYVGSNQVHEFSTTEAIQKAIQDIRRKDGKGSSFLHNTQVTLIVSASVVSWYNTKTKSLIKEHDIRSIQCTCQASDDLRHLALVTRAPDPLSDRSHSCHVFCLDSVEVATEAILTLGQAFEVAYQLALGSRTLNRDRKGHMRSKSANQLSTQASSSSSSSPTSKLRRDKGFSNNCHTHSRSQSDIAHLRSGGSSSGNSPQLDSHHHPGKQPDYQRFPRADSFSFTSSNSSNNNNDLLTRAPIVSKEEL